MDAPLRYGTPRGTRVIAAVSVGSGMAFLDLTVVNVALPNLGDDLGASFSALQWVLDGYLLTLGALLLLGGSMGDRFGRRRIFFVGLASFTAASLLCAAAPTTGLLIGARLLQGIGGALMAPASLAIVNASFAVADRSEAVGQWAAWSALTTALGPFLGGWLVDLGSWRLVFVINAPIALLTWWLARDIPRTSSDTREPLDLLGATLVTLGLGGIVFGLIEGPVRGWRDPLVLGATAGGALLTVGFVVTQARRRAPMVPLELFTRRQFTGANLVTLVAYGGLNVVLFLVVLQLQRALGYSALEAGSALLPFNLLLVLGSPRAGAWVQRVGFRVPLVVGPLLAGLGMVGFGRITEGSTFLVHVLPAVVLFGTGMTVTVAPLTAAVLDAVPDRRSGIASGVNNAVARLAGLLGVAVIPLLAGMSGAQDASARELADGYAPAMWIAAGLMAIGAVLAAATVGEGGRRADVGGHEGGRRDGPPGSRTGGSR